MSDREPSQLHPVSQTELVEDVGAVTLDRLEADHKSIRDLPRREPLSNQLHDLELPRR